MLVVFSLFILGGLASTAFLLSFAERRVDRMYVRYLQASAAADAGAYAPLNEWDVERYNKLDIGGTAGFSGANPDGTGFYRGEVIRVGRRLFLVAAEGRSVEGGLRQRSATLMRLRPLRLEIDAALETRGPLEIGESVRISGTDRSPYSWACPPETASLPAVKIPSVDSSVAPWSGCDPSRCLEGDPAFVASSAFFGSPPLDLGSATLAHLKIVASHVISGGSLRIQPLEANGTCVTESLNNWGNPYDPGGACGDHFPGVYSEGDLVVRAGQGQGVLVVDGDLTVYGDFHYFGVVIVLGRFMSLGAGSQITGAVIVNNGDLDPQSLAGMTRIQFSKCAVDKSLAGSGRGVLLRERSWLDMY